MGCNLPSSLPCAWLLQRMGGRDRQTCLPQKNTSMEAGKQREKPTKKEKKMVQIKRYYNNSAKRKKKKEKFKLNAKHSTKKSMQSNEVFR